MKDYHEVSELIIFCHKWKFFVMGVGGIVNPKTNSILHSIESVIRLIRLIKWTRCDKYIINKF